MSQDLESLFKDIEDRVRVAFAEEGRILPKAVLRDKENTTIALPLDFGSQDRKDLCIRALKFLIGGAEEIKFCVLVSESWLANCESMDEANKSLPPSQRPDRTEGITMIGEGRDGSRRMGYLPITRNPTALGKFVVMKVGMGNFTDLFPTKAN